MANHQVLDNVTHQDLKIIIDQHPDYGDVQSYATLVPSELSAAQTDYPIFFRRNSAVKTLEIIALLGLGDTENLFLDSRGWHAHYVPLSIQRKPFLIGLVSNNGVEEPQIHIDMDSPRVNKELGESVFLTHGGQSEFLQSIASILNALHQGHLKAQAFIEILQSLGLIENVNLSVKLNDGDTLELSELLTVNEDALAKLPAEKLYQLHERGFLKLVYMMIASINNMTKLIELKNKQIESTQQSALSNAF